MKNIILSALFITLNTVSIFAADTPLNIAHRGASGYLPEHTLAAKAMAYAQGADYIEQDVALTKDFIPIIIHDIHLNNVTDVAEKFPDKMRDDNKYYVIDFTYDEIKSLNVNEAMTDSGKQRFKDRFPAKKSSFKLHTLSEEIEFIQGLNRSTGKNIGIYTEIKEPKWHLDHGKDITLIVLAVLAKYGYKNAEDKCYLQCFDADELKRVRFNFKSKLKLVQLIEEDEDEDEDTDEDADINEIATYADGVGPAIKQLYKTDFMQKARKANLKVHPYTFRKDLVAIENMSSKELLNFLFKTAKVDGVFSDFPDITRDFIRSLK
ncbi:MAG: glycerophosphodiester phosphodiesterase [Pusillimonas sp.]